ncbi:hypothetical protein ACNAQ8_31665 [Pseudomonas aeruginosa]|uniref:hypothetical protein n=1 Tax=Pseudomonas aeruginosa TaxID=287 RepID=UPI000A82627F|nr:hypothetical protein [Pseudomonas aeruginosa]MBA4868014.1 hypothetical protein [Pseudomonas aeruginosa]MBA4984821.1 hypothetical protein [Pseudomonas aeruginosa]MBY9358017.1 hypothetical protein [Pseudomonas aeruginosa]MBY9465425.1 hypothetical protein [Pseudomonas aeruginosa]MBY9541647.1 hypothetical protein [Pseudomonas aeruginosa]
MRAWIAVGILIILSGCGDGSDELAGDGNNAQGVVDDWIFKDYEDNSIIFGSDSSDPSYMVFRDRVADVNRQKNEAAVLASRKCKHVVSVIFIRKESSLDNLRFMVDCEDGDRFSITSRDIESGSPVKSNSQRAIGKSDAIERCKGVVEKELGNSKNLEFSELLGSAYYKAPNGNVRLVLNFEEIGMGGSRYKLKASCTFDSDWNADLNISRR